MTNKGRRRITALIVAGFIFLCIRPFAIFTFVVTDDDNHPIEGVDVIAWTFLYWSGGGSSGFGEDHNQTFHTKTDASGRVTLIAGSRRGEFGYRIEKAGYYQGGSNSFQFSSWFPGIWFPWNHEVRLGLHKISHPIPLFARWVEESHARKTAHLPAFGQKAGFDLVASDWVAPYGTGKVADLIFQFDGITQKLSADYSATLTVTFSDPQDGFFAYDPKKSSFFPSSVLTMPNFAPESGYQGKLIEQSIRHGNRTTRPNSGLSYYLRLRTVVDADGKIISANYAKVPGGLKWDANGDLGFCYFFNPTPNDRNLEFDYKHNLLKLGSLERRPQQ